MNVNGILEDFKELFSPLAPYFEYICMFPQRYMIDAIDDLEQTDQKNNEKFEKFETNIIPRFCIFSVVNESTREKVIINNVIFNEKTESIIMQNQHEISLTDLVQDIINKLYWSPSKQVIIASNGSSSFSYGIEYYLMRNINGEFVDLCIKDNIANNYVCVTNLDLKEKEYIYNDLCV